MQECESLSQYRKMSAAQFIEEVMGLKLLWYQKLMLSTLDARDRFEKKYLPYKYWFRFYIWRSTEVVITAWP